MEITKKKKSYSRDEFFKLGDGLFACPAFSGDAQCPCRSHGSGEGFLTRMEMINYLTRTGAPMIPKERIVD